MPVRQNTRFSPRHPHPHTPARKLQFLGGAVPPTTHLIAWRRPAVGRNPSSLPKVPQRAAHRTAAISHRLRKCFQIVSEFNSLSVHRLLHLVNGSNYAGKHLNLRFSYSVIMPNYRRHSIEYINLSIYKTTRVDWRSVARTSVPAEKIKRCQFRSDDRRRRATSAVPDREMTG